MMKISPCVAIAALVLGAGAASADVLLNQGTNPNGSGRTVGTNSDWTVYQPFDVTDAAGWNLTTIKLDGWRVVGGGVMAVDVLDSTEAVVASTTITFINTDAFQSSFEAGAVNVDLTGGAQYIIRAKMQNFGEWNAIYHGNTGLPSFSRNNTGGEFPANPIAMILEGTVIPTPGALALLGLGGLAAARRRR